MRTLKQSKEGLENTMKGRNGFYRGVLWATKWITTENELPILGKWIITRTRTPE